MRKLKNIKWLPVLMALSILAITAFQYYWLHKAYEREDLSLNMRTNMLFRETVRSLQAYKLKLDKFSDTLQPATIIVQKANGAEQVKMRPGSKQKMVSMIDVMMKRLGDSVGRVVMINRNNKDTAFRNNTNFSRRRDRMMQFLYDVDSLQDSIKIKELDTAFARRLDEQNLDVPFKIKRIPTREMEQPKFNEITLGFARPITYQLKLGNTSGFLLRRIMVPILFSFFLVAFTLMSFTLLYRNLLRQKKLADIKNEFISNITHELKTPIATVSVAIEALRSFNASMDPLRTKEYLDISANELQRLSMLVDKVLKLSMFEKKEVELKYEELDMKKLVDEVTSSMRLQFEKYGAAVSTQTEGDTNLSGDRLHLVSVIFNLMDNALKYSPDKPVIKINIKGYPSQVELSIADSGIGIAQEYQGKIFEKFFRVPTGNLHNAKGYGLGLSYVAHVVKRHHGTIKVESIPGDGSRFIISLPRQQA